MLLCFCSPHFVGGCFLLPLVIAVFVVPVVVAAVVVVAVAVSLLLFSSMFLLPSSLLYCDCYCYRHCYCYCYCYCFSYCCCFCFCLLLLLLLFLAARVKLRRGKRVQPLRQQRPKKTQRRGQASVTDQERLRLTPKNRTRKRSSTHQVAAHEGSRWGSR